MSSMDDLVPLFIGIGDELLPPFLEESSTLGVANHYHIQTLCHAIPGLSSNTRALLLVLEQIFMYIGSRSGEE